MAYSIPNTANTLAASYTSVTNTCNLTGTIARNSIIAFVYVTAGHVLNSVTDSVNTYTIIPLATTTTTSVTYTTATIYVAYANNIAGGSVGIVGNLSSAVGYSWMCAAEVAGGQLFPDRVITNTGGAVVPNAGTFTPTYSNEIVVAMYGGDSSTDGVGAGWTQIENLGLEAMTEYLIQTSPVSVTGNFTGSYTDWAAMMVSFSTNTPQNYGSAIGSDFHWGGGGSRQW